MLLEVVANGQVAELRRVHVPGHRVAAGPVAAGGRAEGHGHADAVAGVEARAANLRQVPARAQVAGAPSRVGLEAATSQDHRIRRQRLPADGHMDAVVGAAQSLGPLTVADVYAGLFCDGGKAVYQARAAAPCLHREAAPEPHLAIYFEGLAAVQRQKTHAQALHPQQGFEARLDQPLGEGWIRAILRHPAHVVVELLAAVAAEVRAADLVGGEFRHQTAEVSDAVVDRAQGAGREARVAAAQLERGALEQRYVCAALAGGDSRVQRRIAAADHGHAGHPRAPSARSWAMASSL